MGKQAGIAGSSLPKSQISNRLGSSHSTGFNCDNSLTLGQELQNLPPSHPAPVLGCRRPQPCEFACIMGEGEGPQPQVKIGENVNRRAAS
jgi:hypothetical protein